MMRIPFRLLCSLVALLLAAVAAGAQQPTATTASPAPPATVAAPGQADKPGTATQPSQLPQTGAKAPAPTAPVDETQVQEPMEPGAVQPEPSAKLQPFGYNFFRRSDAGFESIQNIPPPAEYPIGAGDVINITLTSPVGQETDLSATVDPSGRVRVPNVGLVRVSGMTIAKAEQTIASAVRAKFPSLATSASLNSIRPIQVFVIGEVMKPGSYVLPGLSTLLNALYAAGGPNLAGSLRTITVQRNRRTVAKADLYQILLNGDRSKDIALQSGDSVFVGTLGPTVTVRGEVRRPAIYELLGESSVRSVLDMAGGTSGLASLRNVRLERNLGSVRKIVLDLKLETRDAPNWRFEVQNGDQIIVQPILETAENSITISGPVKRPGEYELSDNMTLSQLVQRAEGFTDEEIYLERATIMRTGENGSGSMLSVNLGKAMAGDEAEDIRLQRGDRVTVYTVREATALDRTVTVSGEVAREGVYDRTEGMRLRDLILLAGGAKPEAYETVEIARVHRPSGVVQTLNANLKRAIQGDENDNILLADGDRVAVRNVRQARSTAPVVRIRGEVNLPGTYAITSTDERLSSLIARAGGMTMKAFPKGAVFVRNAPIFMSEQQMQTAAEIQTSLRELGRQEREMLLARYGVRAESNPAAAAVDEIARAQAEEAAAVAASEATTGGQEVTASREVRKVVRTARLPLDMDSVLKEPGGVDDVVLEDGDTIVIPQRPTVISVAGAVVSPSVVLYRDGLKVEDYVARAGGYARDADTGKAVVVRANGEVLRAEQAGSVELGDVIIVPSRGVKPPRSRWEFVSDLARVVGGLAITGAVLLD